jgi:hypothetical protein
MISITERISFVTTRPAILGLEDFRVYTIVSTIFYKEYFPIGAFGFSPRTG